MAKSGSKSVTVTSWDTLKFSWWFNDDDQSVENNSTLVRWKLELISTSSGRIDSTASKNWSVTVNGKTYKGTNKVGISNNSTKTLASGTTPIEHDSDGSKTFSYSFGQQFSITFSGSYIGTKSGSGTGTLDTIPRKSTLSVGNGTLGTALTLTVTRESTSFTHSIKVVCGSSTLYIKADGTTSASEVKHNDLSISFTPPLSWASQNTTGTSVSVTYTITTYNGNTSLGSNSYSKTCNIPASLKPYVELSVTDAMGYADTFGGYVQGKSKFKIVVSTAESYGSPIKTYKTTADGKTYTAATITTGVISGKGTLTINVTVTDSRGRTATASKDVTVLAYSTPTISSMKCYRSDAGGIANSTGEYLAIAFDSSITSLNNKNSATYELQYKKTTDDEYTTKPMTDFEGQYSVSGGVFVFSANKSSSYNIVLILTDSFSDPVKKAGSGASIKKRFSILKSVFGFAIGKIAELPNVFDIALQTRFLGGILHPVLEPETDLNEVMTPNTYIGANVSTNKYANCPLTTGTFTLEVVGMGEEGQTKQRLTYCHKTDSKAWERIYHADASGVKSWGDWVCVSDFAGQLLWEGGYYMTEGHTVPLAEAVSKQQSGIVLVFSRYDSGTVYDHNFNCFYVPKMAVALQSGKQFAFFMASPSCSLVAQKFLYIEDETVKGYYGNSQSGTGDSGIKYDNSRYVLRYVIGV